VNEDLDAVTLHFFGDRPNRRHVAAEQSEPATLSPERSRDRRSHPLCWSSNDRDMPGQSEVHSEAPIDAGALPDGHGILAVSG
jgi:hypothetical protein